MTHSRHNDVGAARYRVTQQIRRMIAAQGFRPGDTLPDADVLAKQLDVSRIMVHRALADLVARRVILQCDNRSQVIAAHTDPHSPLLTQIGLVTFCVRGHLFHYRYLSEIMRGVLAACDWGGIDVNIHSRATESADSCSHPNELLASADGVLLLGDLGEDYVAQLAATKIPMVVMDYQVKRVPVDCLACDNAGAVDAVMDHLFQLGHRRILFLSKSNRIIASEDSRVIVNDVDCRERRDAYMHAMEMHGLSHLASTFVLGNPSSGLEDARRLIQEIRRAEYPVTAIVADDTRNLATVYKMLTIAGVKVPEEVSLATCAGAEKGVVLENGLPVTYSVHDFVEMGRRAVQKLRLLCDGALPTAPDILRIGYTFYRGATTAAPRVSPRHA